MTLHEAIEKLLRQTGRPMTTQQIADELNKNGWYQKKTARQSKHFKFTAEQETMQIFLTVAARQFH